VDSGFLRGVDVADFVADKEDFAGLQFCGAHDAAEDATFAEEFRGTFDEFEKFEAFLGKECGDIFLGVRGEDAEAVAFGVKLADEGGDAVEGLNGADAECHLGGAALGDAGKFDAADAKLLHELAGGKIACGFQLCGGELFVAEFVREVVEDFEAEREGVREGAVEIKEDELGFVP